MEGPASVLCLRTCYIKHCKPLRLTENPLERAQSCLSRSCSCSHRGIKQRRSNSVSNCTLPIIPEHPGFQDIKLSRNYSGIPAFNQHFQHLERGKKPSFQLNSFPRRPSLVHCSGSSSSSHLDGHQAARTGFHDKPLQEYFNERLMELGSYGSQRSNRKTKACADQNQKPSLTHRGSQCRGSCRAVEVTGHGKDSREPSVPANQGNKAVIEFGEQEVTQNVLKLYKGDLLDILTTHITAPLEPLVQKK